MSRPADLQDALLAAWRTNNRVTIYLIEHLPPVLWRACSPAIPTRTVRSVAAHLHNARCWWVRTLGLEHGIATPTRVDHREGHASRDCGSPEREQ